MFVEVPEEDSILIDGPAKARVVSGRVSILGAEYSQGSEFSARFGKRLPMRALEGSSLELDLEEGGSYSIRSDDPIPGSWKEAAEEVITSRMSRVMIVGEVDSGKSGFSLFLANVALSQGRKVAIIDADIGQTDIGPPGTVGLAIINEPRISLYGVQPSGLSFVGAKNPSSAILPLLRSMKRMRKGALRIPLDLLIVNTDGWISGDTAIYLKYVTSELFEVGAVVAIEKGDELEPLLEALSEAKIIPIKSPLTVKQRDREARKEPRHLNFARYLEGKVERTFPLKIVHGLREEDNWRGLLVGLEGERWRLLGIGILQSIDWEKKEIEVSTPLKAEVKSVQIGKIRLDENGEEIEDSA